VKVLRKTVQNGRDRVAAILALLCAGFFVLLVEGCAETNYAEGYTTPEAPYNIYHGPNYYPYFPWYSYYGGAYYYYEY
jgi:hypothetical protein